MKIPWEELNSQERSLQFLLDRGSPELTLEEAIKFSIRCHKKQYLLRMYCCIEVMSQYIK